MILLLLLLYKMGPIGKVSGTLVLLGAVYIYVKVNRVPPIPTIEEKWWGPGGSHTEDTSVKPFKINVPDEVIDDLKDRLNKALPFHPPLEGVNHNYGINTKLFETIVDYWKNKYNWKKRQEFLNQFSQFETNIQGLKIHFIHEKPKNVPQGVQVLRLILLHGWPGSVREFYEMIPILTTQQSGADFVFEVIVPSIPGYGFSDGAARPGLGPAQIAQLFNKLMIRLKFDRYYVHGGDCGSVIGQALAVVYSDNVVGLHRNLCFAPNTYYDPKVLLGSYFPSLFFTEKEIEHTYPLSDKLSFLILESGYFHLQATKPDTIGIGLRDSPVGLAAYILEKFIAWTNPAWKDLPDGGLTKKFTMDQLLDNVMIYWITRSITTSVRLYSEAYSWKHISLGLERIPVKIPAGCNRFKHELFYSPEFILRKNNLNLIHLTDFDDGGHFAAFELPDILAKDVFEFVQKVRNLPKQTKEL